MEYITFNKGGRKLAFENNIYIKQKVLSNGKDWGNMMGGFCPGGFCLGGFCPRGDFVQGDFVQGDFVRGILSGGFCPGGFCPRTVLRTNKLKKITKVAISLNELDNSDNLEDGRPSNTLFTYYVTSPEDFTSFEPRNPHYMKLKYGENCFLNTENNGPK